MVAAHDLQPGMMIELVGKQTLYHRDMTAYEAGTRLRVRSAEPLPTGRTDRQPYDILFETVDGDELPLEVNDTEPAPALSSDVDQKALHRPVSRRLHAALATA